MFGSFRIEKTSANSSEPRSISYNSSGSYDFGNGSIGRAGTMFDTSQSYTEIPFDVHFLGIIQDVNLGGPNNKDPDVQLIDKLEEGQLEGKISLIPKDENLVSLAVSKYGIKVSNQKEEILQRHPLHTVAQVVCYADSFYKSNVAFKIGQVGRTVFDCYVFQCHNENQAQDICNTVKSVFEAITSR